MPTLSVDSTDIAAAVRAHTMRAHHDAESRPFIVALMKGELTLADYTRYLAQLAWIYEALEARPARAGDPEIIDPRLARMPAIESDLIALGAADWRQVHPALPETADYAEHLSSLVDLPRYLAHHYTRYLGDLSGGQAISRLVARHYGATEAQLTFFDFDDLGDLVHYKRTYRDRLNALRFTNDESISFLAEADVAFRCNSAIFDALGR